MLWINHFLPFLQPFLILSGIYTCSAQGVWMNEVLGRNQPTCLPGTSPSSPLFKVSHPRSSGSRCSSCKWSMEWEAWCFDCFLRNVFRGSKVREACLTPFQTNQSLYIPVLSHRESFCLLSLQFCSLCTSFSSHMVCVCQEKWALQPQALTVL